MSLPRKRSGQYGARSQRYSTVKNPLVVAFASFHLAGVARLQEQIFLGKRRGFRRRRSNDAGETPLEEVARDGAPQITLTAILSYIRMTGRLSKWGGAWFFGSSEEQVSEAASDLIKVIAGVRRCFWLLATVSDEITAALGLTASLRAILEHLQEYGPQTVPQIAKEKSVRRQSIQALVDQLSAGGFVTIKPNPAHRRSVLVALSAKGKSSFAEITKRERAKLREVMRGLEGENLSITAQTLVALQMALRNLSEGDQADAA